MHRLFFEKEIWVWKPGKVEFHCSFTFLVKTIKEESNALGFQVVDITGLLWGFYNIVPVENTPREQCIVKCQVFFKCKISLVSNCSKGVNKMTETVWSGVT